MYMAQGPIVKIGVFRQLTKIGRYITASSRFKLGMQHGYAEYSPFRLGITQMQRCRNLPASIGLADNGSNIGALFILYIMDFRLIGGNQVSVLRQNEHFLVFPDWIVVACQHIYLDSRFIQLFTAVHKETIGAYRP